MITSSSGVLYTVYDGRKRTIMVCRRTKRNTMMYVFRRYKDMSESDKEKVKALHAMVVEQGNVISSDEGDPSDIDSFLAFHEQRPCG